MTTESEETEGYCEETLSFYNAVEGTSGEAFLAKPLDAFALIRLGRDEETEGANSIWPSVLSVGPVLGWSCRGNNVMQRRRRISAEELLDRVSFPGYRTLRQRKQHYDLTLNRI